MSYSASLVASAFVKKGIEEGNFVTQMKLQKMVYFAHGYHLAKFDRPLVAETFEAWKYGPVIPVIYKTYRFYGSGRITDLTLANNGYENLLDAGVLDEKAMEAVNYTWQVTKNLSAISLSAWSHTSDAPWAKVYNPNETSTVINNASIREYFKTLLTANVQ